MSDIDSLVQAYGRFVKLPWSRELAYQQRVWMVVYPPKDERRIRARITDFEVSTMQSGHGWLLIDLSDAFGTWLGSHPYRDSYFEEPDFLSDAALEEFGAYVRDCVVSKLDSAGASIDTAVTLLGAGALFPFYRVSRLVNDVAEYVKGRLVVLFPGERDGSNYRLLEARDGWNYLATPITATEDSE